MSSAPKQPKRSLDRGLFLILLALLGLMVLSALAPSNSSSTTEPQTQPPNLIRGGQLYIAWDQLIPPEEIPPQHPLWPKEASSQVPPVLTWRCVNCHGWDYSGSTGKTLSGAYRSMGYPGLFRLTSASLEEITPWLNGLEYTEHDFTNYLSGQDLINLAAFISSGLVAPELIADPETYIVQGTLEVGDTVYEEYCSSCHGLEGERINLGTVTRPTFLGDLAWTNPWRMAHTIRYGHLTTRLPSASDLGLSFSQQLDIIAFTQTLPNATVITAPDFQDFDASSQASTIPITIGAIAISALVFLTVAIILKRH